MKPISYMLIPALKRNDVVKKITKDYILEKVCNYFRVLPSEVKTKSRKRRLVVPRQYAMYFMNKLNVGTENSIGEYFDKDHSTVNYAKKTIENICDVSSKDRDIFLKLENEIING